MALPANDALMQFGLVIVVLMVVGQSLGLGSGLFEVGGNWMQGLAAYVLLSIALRSVSATFLHWMGIPVDPNLLTAAITFGAFIFFGLHMGIGRFFAWIPIFGGLVGSGHPMSSAFGGAIFGHLIALWPYFGQAIVVGIERSVGWPWW